MKCSYDECENDFEPKTHNQKYCSDECCRIATNEKLREQYYEKKARLAGKKRVCKKKDCNAELSRYEERSICKYCQLKDKNQSKKELLGMLENVFGKTDKT